MIEAVAASSASLRAALVVSLFAAAQRVRPTASTRCVDVVLVVGDD